MHIKSYFRKKSTGTTPVIMTVLSLCLPVPFAQTLAQETVNAGNTADVPGTHSSPWNIGGDLTVEGTMNVKTGGVVNNALGIIGNALNSTGSVNVEGTSSSWYNSRALLVGNSGNGTLAIRGGGSVSNELGYIALAVGSKGEVMVDGSGSSWNSRSDLALGLNGNATLAISNGGTVSNMTGFIGTNTGSTGTVTVDGAGSTWSNDRKILIGNSGSGTLAISNDGLVSADGVVRLALDSTSTGTLEISTGGTLQTQALAAGAGTVTTSFNGGILRAIADNAAFITGFAPGALVLDADGLIIDDNGYAIATDDSAFSGIGGLRKAGNGSLTLAGANDYSGATTIASGTLKAGNSNVFSPNSAFVVTTDTTLDLDGFDQSMTSLVNSGSVRTGSAGSANGLGTTLAVNGTYESNGGSLTLRTTLGNDSAPTDKLIADSVTTGAGGATKLYIANVGGLGAYTTSTGIEIVQVATTSSSDAFVLGAPVMVGAYEYLLEQSANQSWYLTNRSSSLMNPNIGSTLGNQYAATTMFTHNVLDRHESVRTPGYALWVRARHNALNTDLLDGSQHVDIRTSVVQIGADLVRYEGIVAGIFGGYGHASTENRSNQTGTKANGRVDAANIGFYASWVPEENKGPYADVWGTYAWYGNELRGHSQNRRVTYDSSGHALSAEAGYGFTLTTESDGRAWILKPHAQLSYVSLDTDSFEDSHGTWYGDSRGSGMQSRLGARFHGQRAAGQTGISPFVELNWLHNGVDNAVRLDGTKISSTIGKNVGELKAGLQGKLSESLSVWGHLGAQRGTAGFERYELQIGLGWQW